MLPLNHEVTSQHPFLPVEDFLALMQHAAISVPMQQGHSHPWSNRDGFRIAIPASRLRIEDSLSTSAGGKVDEECPGCASLHGRCLLICEGDGIGVVIYAC